MSSNFLLDVLPVPMLVAAIELGSVWMLGWLAAAGIPLALHLLHRRRQQELPWAAVELLMQAIRQNSRTIRLEQWLLLLLRTAVMLLLAIALARPLMRSVIAPSTESVQPPKHWILVLDGSYSMGTLEDRTSMWQRAQQRAVGLVRQSSASDAFSLIQLTEPSLTIIGQPVFDATRVTEEIQRLKCTDDGGDLSSCLQLIDQIISDTPVSEAAARDIEVVFFTDMGKDTWQSVVSSSSNDRKLFEQLSGRCHLRVERVAANAPQNVAVTGLESDSPIVLYGKSLRCVAAIQNFGPKSLDSVPVQFRTAGATLHTEFVQCPAGQTRTVTVELAAPEAVDSWDITVALPDDDLMIDNQRFLIASVRPQIRVLTVEEPVGAARLINLGLAPLAKATTSAAAISVETCDPIDLESRDLEEFDAVVLADISQLNEITISRLAGFATRGGSVLGLFGPRTSADAFNLAVARASLSDTASAMNSMADLFGYRLREATAVGDWRIDPIGYASPIAKPFANFLDAGLLTTPIFRYWKIEPVEGVRLVRDIDFVTGDPWIVRRSLGAGSVGSMLSAPESGTSEGGLQTASWNAFATWPSFVPVMQKLVETIVVGGEYERNVDVGQPLRGWRAEPSSTGRLKVRRPDDSTNQLALSAISNNQKSEWSYSQTDRAGIYRVEVDGTNEQSFAVNIVPNQSDLQSVPGESLPHGRGLPAAATSKVAAARELSSGQGQWLTQACLVALLVVLGAESILAWHLGRRLS